MVIVVISVCIIERIPSLTNPSDPLVDAVAEDPFKFINGELHIDD